MSDVAINWFDIPVKDLERAARFYGTVLDTEIGEMQGPTGVIKVFQKEGMPVGALSQGEQNSPSDTGTRIFLNSDDIDGALGRVKKAGGKVVMPKTSIGEYGHIASFRDTEGNVVALHSNP